MWSSIVSQIYSTRWWKPRDIFVISFDKTNVRRTDGRTDRRTDTLPMSTSHYSIAERDNNQRLTLPQSLNVDKRGLLLVLNLWFDCARKTGQQNITYCICACKIVFLYLNIIYSVGKIGLCQLQANSIIKRLTLL